MLVGSSNSYNAFNIKNLVSLILQIRKKLFCGVCLVGFSLIMALAIKRRNLLPFRLKELVRLRIVDLKECRRGKPSWAPFGMEPGEYDELDDAFI